MRRGLLIFDLDGTLFRAEAVTLPAVHTAFGEQGLMPPPPAQILNFIGRPDPEFHVWLTSQVGSELGKELSQRIPQLEVELIRSHGALIEGAAEALEALRGMVKQMAICSNGPESYVRAVIEGLGLTSLFDELRWRLSTDTGKPQMVADLLSRREARPAAVIGDRADDIEAAHANGIFAIAAGYGFCQPGDTDRADAVANSPGELVGIVERLFAE